MFSRVTQRSAIQFRQIKSLFLHQLKNNRTSSKRWLPFSVAAGLGASVALTTVAFASEAPHPPHYDWSHQGYFASFDHAALRRGFEVYRQVCSTCHSLESKSYRELVGVTHTEEQAKKIAQTITVVDGPNDNGEMFERPGKLSDRFSKPYPNEEYARMINGGAVPPDLSQMINARHNGENYVFSILTGYQEPPTGVDLRSGLHYNVYFPGNAIAMAPPLVDGAIENEDGTPATKSQMAKDVVSFLSWCAMPEHDERKKTGMKLILILLTGALFVGYCKKRCWAPHKTRKITWVR